MALRLRLRQRGEEIVEARIAAVEPMVLDAVADQPAAPLAFGRAGIVDEGDVGGGQAILHRHRFERGEQLLRTRRPAAAARHRRERHRDLQLGIILPARPLPGLGPAVVEHIFALAVALEIGGRGGDQPPVVARSRSAPATSRLPGRRCPNPRARTGKRG